MHLTKECESWTLGEEGWRGGRRWSGGKERGSRQQGREEEMKQRLG